VDPSRKPAETARTLLSPQRKDAGRAVDEHGQVTADEMSVDAVKLKAAK